MRNPIALIGFMACGKTTIGTLLSGKLGVPFHDLDAFITEKIKMPITDIFDSYGEAHFRRLEAHFLRVLSGEKNIVLSTGGGVITTPENISELRRHFTVVYLYVTPVDVMDRTGNDTTRPLLKSKNKAQKLCALYKERLEDYERAAHIIVNARMDADNVVKQIIYKLQKQRLL